VVCEGAGACVLSGQGTFHLKVAPEYNSEFYEKLERIFAHFRKHLISTYIYSFFRFRFQ
jgi:hypothetical protein